MLAAALIPLITALATEGYSLYSTNQAQKEADKEQKILDKRFESRLNDLSAWYNSEYNTPVTQSDYGKSFLGEMNASQQEALERMEGNAVVGGATTESKVAGEKALQGMYAKGLSGLMQYGDSRKQGIRNSYMAQLNSLNGSVDQMTLARMQGWYNWAENASKAGGNLALASAEIDWNDVLKNFGTGNPNAQFPGGTTVGSPEMYQIPMG